MKAPRGHGRAAGPWLLLLSVSHGVLGSATQSPTPTTAPVAPVLEKRAEVLTERPDFFAWVSGLDASWTPSYCYSGGLTTIGTNIGCCGSGDCWFGMSCQSNSIIETIIEVSGTRDRTQTRRCSGPVPGYTCFSGSLLQNFGDKNGALMRYYCGFDGGVPVVPRTDKTWYRTLPADAKVFTTTPSGAGDTLPASSTSGPTDTGRQTTARSGTDTGTGTGPGSQRTDQPPPTDAGGASSGLGNSDKIGIGIGVGLGVPLVAIALLAWLCPSPLKRRRERKSAVAALATAPDGWQKPELGGHPHMDAAQQAPQYPVYQQQQQQQQQQQPTYQDVSYGHSPPPAELYGYQPPELPGNALHGNRAG